MSITNSISITNQIGALFNLLGIYVTHKKPVTSTNDYGEIVADSYTETQIKTLPYNQNTNELFQESFGDLDFGSQYFAIEKDKDFVEVNDLINYNGVDYVVNRRVTYSWGEVVMFAIQAKPVQE